MDQQNQTHAGPEPALSGTKARRPYHHGDLRAALLIAAEAELAEKGIEAFTLRGCARRAGVSHAAPSHHFKDVKTLLTEMAAIGFERLSMSMERHAAGTDPGTYAYVLGISQGYLAFARFNPHHFRLLFRNDAIDCANPRFQAVASQAFAYPKRAVGRFYGSDDPMADRRLAAQVIGLWSLVHGMSETDAFRTVPEGHGGSDIGGCGRMGIADGARTALRPSRPKRLKPEVPQNLPLLFFHSLRGGTVSIVFQCSTMSPSSIRNRS